MEKLNLNHKIICDNRKYIQLTGIEKVDSSNETQVVCRAINSSIIIYGKNMHVKKLDIEQGILEIDGTIDCFKYQTPHKNLLKRLFK